jgi:hypothetical protein
LPPGFDPYSADSQHTDDGKFLILVAWDNVGSTYNIFKYSLPDETLIWSEIGPTKEFARASQKITDDVLIQDYLAAAYFKTSLKSFDPYVGAIWRPCDSTTTIGQTNLWVSYDRIWEAGTGLYEAGTSVETLLRAFSGIVLNDGSIRTTPGGGDVAKYSGGTWTYTFTLPAPWDTQEVYMCGIESGGATIYAAVDNSPPVSYRVIRYPASMNI